MGTSVSFEKVRFDAVPLASSNDQSSRQRRGRHVTFCPAASYNFIKPGGQPSRCGGDRAAMASNIGSAASAMNQTLYVDVDTDNRGGRPPF
jgi:uncharacterized Zn-binding protein involved in type VI secretion